MYNIMIVDDEPKIVDMLYEHLMEWRMVELEVYRAYTAFEALETIERTKIHIVLTDINMPGMSGLELQAKISRLWPRCKIIFLTGYNDFEFIQTALRNGAFDFILKIEDDEAIIAAINKALAKLQSDMALEQYMFQAEQQLKTALPSLQKEFIWSLLQGELSSGQITQERFRELRLPLNPELGILLIAGRVDRWPDEISPSDKTLFTYAIDNIAAEYLGTSCTVYCSHHFSNLIWLIQPSSEMEGLSGWKECAIFVYGMLSDIQVTLEKLTKLPVSLAVSSAAHDWPDVPVQYLKLQQLLWQGFGLDKEIILQDQSLPAQSIDTKIGEDKSKQEIVLLLRKAKSLQDYLESGQRERYFELYAQISFMAHELSKTMGYNGYLAEIQLALTSVLLSYINQAGLLHSESLNMQLEPLLGKSSFHSWKEADLYFARLAEHLFSTQGSEQMDRTTRIVAIVNQYIDQHVDTSLSLDILADQVYLHPAYLSRLYKQATGRRLSDYIKDVRIQKAKELLADQKLKVHEVAARVGFETSYYFSKVFKKEMNLTPQEYRDRCGSIDMKS
ncbi:response regulator transcription factor [Paenibacillus mendelii]|uniref:Response regulator n=1 Tax=Paenibacillus mendelii TaxID=206163 RepID=A0ABV6J9N7_9BACL|nr:response regulator [Paenibacillus mendelii]MCQ6563895.1 response regulator [Paenibacillus mendelii]